MDSNDIVIPQYVKQSVTLITETNPFKRTEIFGRKSYKSENRITDDSYKPFFKNILIKGHTAVLEAFDVYIEFVVEDFVKHYDYYVSSFVNPTYCHIQYTHQTTKCRFYTNARHILDVCPKLFEDIVNDTLPTFITKFTPSDNHPYKRYMFDITTDRGISHEFVRHRCFSFLQESTRYVKYEKSGIEVIKPSVSTVLENEQVDKALYHAANAYRQLRLLGSKPEDARDVLPTCTKTELFIVGFLKDFIGHNVETFQIEVFGETIECKFIKGFDTLRNSKSAHPKAQEISRFIKNEIIRVIGAENYYEIKQDYFD